MQLRLLSFERLYYCSEMGVIVAAGYVSRVAVSQVGRHDARHLKLARENSEMRFGCTRHRDDADRTHAQRGRQKGRGASLHEKNVLLQFAALDQPDNGLRIGQIFDHSRWGLLGFETVVAFS